MLSVAMARPGSLSVLALGAHADDIEIGCGATILRLVRENPGMAVRWVVFSGRGERQREAHCSANAFLCGARRAEVTVLQHRDGFFPYDGCAIKEAFEALKDEVQPDVVLTHHRGDLHQDHRLLGELTWNTFRDAMVLEYEIPKYDGDLGAPNLFVPVDEETARAKVALLDRHFPSQRGRDWWRDDTFHALMRLRGIESRSPTGLAEAFYARKVVLDPAATQECCR